MAGVLSALALRLARLRGGWHFRHASVGGTVLVWGPIEVVGGRKARIGRNVHIQRGAYIQAGGGLAIGDNVHVGRNLTLLTENHRFEKAAAIPYDSTVVRKPVAIRDNVWIGSNVSIVPGVTIGEGAIVGLGSVVTHDVPELAIVGGNPAKVLRQRDADEYWRLKREGRFH